MLLNLVLIRISLWKEKKELLGDHSEGNVKTFTVGLRTGNKSSLLCIFLGPEGWTSPADLAQNYRTKVRGSTTAGSGAAAYKTDAHNAVDLKSEQATHVSKTKTYPLQKNDTRGVKVMSAKNYPCPG